MPCGRSAAESQLRRQTLPEYARDEHGLSLIHIFIHIFIDAPTETAMQTAVLYLRILSPFYFVVSAKLVADGILRGAGVMGKFMVSTFTDLILRVVLAVRCV